MIQQTGGGDNNNQQQHTRHDIITLVTLSYHPYNLQCKCVPWSNVNLYCGVMVHLWLKLDRNALGVLVVYNLATCESYCIIY